MKRIGPRSSKEYAPYIEAFTKLGGRVNTTGGGHLILLPPHPQQQPLVISSSPSGPTSVHKLRSFVRNAQRLAGV